MKTKDKKVDKPLKHKGKLYSVKELIDELGLRSQVDVLINEDSWFNKTMLDLDKKDKQ